MTLPSWQRHSAQKRAARDALLPAGWLLDNVPQQSDVSRVTGNLSARETEITAIDDIEALLRRIRLMQYTALETTIAFCKRATIAQQLTNCLTEVLFDDAMTRAKELDDYQTKTGQVTGPLHGLPVSLKDQFCIKGVECTMGNVAQHGCVRYCFRHWHNGVALKAYSSILYCRTNVPQTLLSAETDNWIFGATVNPLNRKLTAGGSSGGEGALICMRGSSVGFGTDIGGSVRIPAACVGLYGIRVTCRRLPYHGAVNYLEGLEALESSIGLMARSIDTCAAMLRFLLQSNPHDLDPSVIEMPWRPDLYESPSRGHKLSFGLLASDGVVKPHPPILRACRMVREALEAAGHEVFEWRPPVSHADLIHNAVQIILAAGHDEFRHITRQSKEPRHESIDLGAHAPITVWESWQLTRQRNEYRKAYLDAWQASRRYTQTERPMDGLLMPVAPCCAHPLQSMRPYHGYTGVLNLLDYPSCVFPVTNVRPDLDPPDPTYLPISTADALNWQAYDPATFWNAPVCLQIAGRRFQDEAVLGMTRVISKALQSYQQQQQQQQQQQGH